MGLSSQFWHRVTNAKMLLKDTKFSFVEWCFGIDCLTIQMPAAEADRFPDDMFKDHDNRISFDNDTIHMSWVFNVDRPYERAEVSDGDISLSFKLTPVTSKLVVNTTN